MIRRNSIFDFFRSFFFVKLKLKRRAYRDSSRLFCFDEAFYLESNPDVAVSHLSARQHFLLHGWREGRDPCRYFSISGYINENEDVKAADINPLLHFLEYGFAEGRTGWESSSMLEKRACAFSDLADRPPAKPEKAAGGCQPFSTPSTCKTREPWTAKRAELTSVILGYEPP